MVFMRIIYKRWFSAKKQLGSDDWTVLVAILIGLASVVVQVFFLTPNGLGKDVWTLSIPKLVDFGHYFYVMEILYLTLITLIKISLSLFYLAIFPGERIRRLLWITVAFHIAFGIAFLTKTVLQCSPISYNWKKFDGDPTTSGHCININASGWANGVLGVVADIWLFALPLTQVKKLKLHWKKKVGAVIMFLTGGMATIMSMLRLKSVLYFANSYNPTWDEWSIVFWSTIEVATGFICCCLPTLRLILVRMYPRVFETESSRTRTSCTASSNVYRRVSASHNTRQDTLVDGDSDGHSQASLVPAHHPVGQKGLDEELDAGNKRVRIRSLQRMPTDEEDGFELTTKSVESKNRIPGD
ncbi:hypothetical protein QQS21_001954 [Conoideocrella luteorostrata]|uniref:Rhodopsin domain-containing protein n=1 Tax=Conoideocrella luteorostrata TaxID=1105319 RepID=A0AAJ0CYJ8_9HYPO|nr:hypothetical protein QQS21_001954 [Conoideocrella luteorostrata]